jgi:hypothetical protein
MNIEEEFIQGPLK